MELKKEIECEIEYEINNMVDEIECEIKCEFEDIIGMSEFKIECDDKERFDDVVYDFEILGDVDLKIVFYKIFVGGVGKVVGMGIVIIVVLLLIKLLGIDMVFLIVGLQI